MLRAMTCYFIHYDTTTKLWSSPAVKRLYESTGDLGRERAYLRRLWTDQYSKVLNVTATELFVF